MATADDLLELTTPLGLWSQGWSFGFFRPDAQAVMFKSLEREIEGTLTDGQKVELVAGWNEGRTDRRLYEDDMARKAPCCGNCGQPLTAGGMAEHACVEDQVYPY